ncbi:hypothetical protein BACINT_00272 [Bacteroides intestinalis DSM 17393]|uniref:Uncharacterized protein n=1 Tax=Bacteroides intestinalis DSM 17393 TaxID=471870 RepID=B3C5T9_9BACE|nr:hypothetical protein BACINT_00272 [Bacteroides intestinalis DSM 17393]
MYILSGVNEFLFEVAIISLFSFFCLLMGKSVPLHPKIEE